MLKPTVRKALKRRRKPIALLAMCVLTLTPAFVSGLHIVFDPSNFAENVTQSLALMEEVLRASLQIRQQAKMLGHLHVSIADALVLSRQALHGPLHEVFADSANDAATVGGQLQNQYPVAFPYAGPAWLDSIRPAWTQAEREQLLHEKKLAESIEMDMEPTAERLTTLIKASNGVRPVAKKIPGTTAVAQAHEELLAVASGETDKLVALRAARGKRRVLASAHKQSEAAYQRARRSELLMGWDSASQTSAPAVRSPF